MLKTTLKLPPGPKIYDGRSVVEFLAKELKLSTADAAAKIASRNGLTATHFIECNEVVAKDDVGIVLVTYVGIYDGHVRTTSSASSKWFKPGVAVALATQQLTQRKPLHSKVGRPASMYREIMDKLHGRQEA